ncbi:MAG: acetoin utilization deacetylase AcuC-like enzyme [Bacillariaceae sp.]|jgi:acetoin utilization deacetylase AcuC-like enzyme
MEGRVGQAVDVVVVSMYHPVIDVDRKVDDDDDNENSSKRNDGLDDFNHPRKRRNLILRELYSRQQRQNNDVNTNANVVFQTPTSTTTTTTTTANHNNNNIDLYRKIHSDGLIDFLSTAWKQWDSLGDLGRDPSCIPSSSLVLSASLTSKIRTPPLIPCNFPLPRAIHQQRRSKNVMGQIGYYCTDTCTPVFAELLEELECDARIVSTAVDIAINNNASNVVYALCTHPGHHAARDSFGGYCYVNNAALTARLLQERLVSSPPSSQQQTLPKVVILDVDYHCGNGTASIFYNDPNVFVISIHCHPDYEYPFHSGYEDETGGDQADGLTLHIPLLPGTAWDNEYKDILQNNIAKNVTLLRFNPDAFILSLGLDTHMNDPCATRRAGFQLSGNDYKLMGESIGEIITNINIVRNSNNSTTKTTTSIPTIVLQEGGYEMTQVPSAATDVVLGMACKIREYVLKPIVNVDTETV